MSDEYQNKDAHPAPSFTRQVIDALRMAFWACIVPPIFCSLISAIAFALDPARPALSVATIFDIGGAMETALWSIPNAIIISILVTGWIRKIDNFIACLLFTAFIFMLLSAVEANLYCFTTCQNNDIIFLSQACGLVVAAAITYHGNIQKKP